MITPVVALDDHYFDLKGLSAYSSMGVSTLRDYISRGDLPAFKVKGKVLIRRSEFDTWIEGKRIKKRQNIRSIANEVVNNLKKA